MATVIHRDLSAAESHDYKPGGTDVAVVDGGTGASTAADARTNLEAPAAASPSTTGKFTHNQAGAADIIDIQDGGASVAKIYDGGIVDLAKQSRCRAYLVTTAQTISNTTATKIAFNAESYDNQNEFDSTTNRRFTATKAGAYLILGVPRWAYPPDAGILTTRIYKNGSATTETSNLPGAQNGFSAPVSDIVSLVANDYIEIYVYQVSGGDLNITADILMTYVSIHKLS